MRRFVLPFLVLLITSSAYAGEVGRLHKLMAEVTWSRTPPPTPADFNPAAAKTFAVTARSWSFSFNPSPFVVNEGDSVTLNISVPMSDGSAHGFFLENYMSSGVFIDRGSTVTVNFIANQPGTFAFACTFYCGLGHEGMNGSFTVNSVAPAPPTITSYTPVSGPTTGGTVLAITGTNFQTGATVRFGTTAALSTNVNNSTSITTMNPARAAGSVTITVTNPDGQSATSTSAFTYEAPAPPPPSISSFTPATGPVEGGTVVTITGSNFAAGAAVTFGGAGAAVVNVVSGTTITATSPPRAAGSVPITVINGDGQSATAASSFTYTATAPAAPKRRRAVRR